MICINSQVTCPEAHNLKMMVVLAKIMVKETERTTRYRNSVEDGGGAAAVVGGGDPAAGSPHVEKPNPAIDERPPRAASSITTCRRHSIRSAAPPAVVPSMIFVCMPHSRSALGVWASGVDVGAVGSLTKRPARSEPPDEPFCVECTSPRLRYPSSYSGLYATPYVLMYSQTSVSDHQHSG